MPSPAMAAAVAVVDLPGGITYLLPHPSCTDPAVASSLDETLHFVFRRWWHIGVSFYYLGALCRSSTSASVTGGLWRLWSSYFCDKDEGGSDVGEAAMVVVVVSSSVCMWYCLRFLVVVESMLLERSPLVYGL